MFSINDSLLLVIDVQGQLAYLMHEKEKLFKHMQALIQAAGHLNIPIIYTEQVPEKIGTTVPEITQYLSHLKPIKKKTFSCCGEDQFLKALKSFRRKQIIVCGIETHVCVYQTVSDLVNKKYQVQVVADAVSSRTYENKTLALERIKSLGVPITATEMIICELLKTSNHEKFKEILKLIK